MFRIDPERLGRREASFDELGPVLCDFGVVDVQGTRPETGHGRLLNPNSSDPFQYWKGPALQTKDCVGWNRMPRWLMKGDLRYTTKEVTLCFSQKTSRLLFSLSFVVFTARVCWRKCYNPGHE